MGDFTELNIRLKLKVDTPENIVEILKYMASLRSQEPTVLPEHSLFKALQWDTMLSSYNDPSGAPVKVSIFEKDKSDESLFMFVRSVYKDRGEAELFFDWIYPYIDALWIEFLGYIKYDSNDHPQLIYYTDEGIRFMAINREEVENIGRREITFSWGIADVSQKL
ncbi:hypothetical protein [Paenibacillus sp. MMO-177]|uniref:hypothetical protein n=1 Tax=Paenibacillus sp. MMO-177 TaxID=3081289 RepID=UPI0030183363